MTREERRDGAAAALGQPRDWLWAAALAALTLAAFHGVLRNDFVYFDDNLYILDNQAVRAGITAEGVRLALTRSYAGNWHPVTWLSHMLDVELFGLDPRGHHAVSLAMHALNAALFYAAFRRVTGRPTASGVAAALFAVHPLHVESVAWVAERKDLLCGLFWALNVLAYAAYAERPGARRYAAVVGAFALCLMSKPMGVTLPVVLLLLDAWPLGRWEGWKGPPALRGEPLRRVLLEKVPLLALVVLSAAVAYTAQLKARAVVPLEGFDLGSRVANAVLSYWRYLGKTLWPVDLAVFYPHGAPSLSDGAVLAGAAALIGVTMAAWRLRGRMPYLLAGWAWYLVTLVPVIGLVQVGNQAMADRYTYLPLLGPFLALGCGLEALAERRPALRRALAAAMGAAVLALAAATWAQTAHWRDTETLFLQALRVTEGNWVAHNNYAGVLLAQGRDEEAVRHLREAIRIRPGYRKAHLNLAQALERAGLPDEAAEHYWRAMGVEAAPGGAGEPAPEGRPAEPLR